MNLIIRKVTVIDPTSKYHHQILDIKIENGIIKEIGTQIENEDDFEELQLLHLHVSKGWFDSSVSFGEPGFEDRETIENGLNVAGKSGFTAVALQPNSYPVIDNQAHVNFVQAKAMNAATKLYPIGALTKNSEGIDLAELFDMKRAGAIAFGDYNQNIDNANLLKIALQYTQDFNTTVIAFSNDKAINGKGIVNEGEVAIQLGLKGIPNLAEEIQIARNLAILEYTGGKLHIPTISTSKAVTLIQEAKKKGLNVTCSVAVHNLVLTDAVLHHFDSRHKVVPPLRSENDRQALLEGLKMGVIDLITSDHNPIDIEHKKMEFDLAKNGTIGLESAFGALLTVLPLDLVIQKLTSGKQLFGIEEFEIQEGSKADVTFFNPELNWEFSKAAILSQSKNSAFLGQKMKGKAIGIYNNNQLLLA